VGLGPRVIDWAIVSYGGDEEARYRGWWFAFRARMAVRLFRTQSSAHNPYDLWTRAPRVIDWVTLVHVVCASVGISCSISGCEWESMP
jgi:hypothetical protein